MGKKNKKKNKKGKKQGNQPELDVPEFDNDLDEETLDDYYVEETKKPKKKVFTGFESVETLGSNKRDVITGLSSDEDNVPAGKKSRAQLKKEKKAAKKRKEAEAKKKAEEAAKKKKKSSKYDDDYSDYSDSYDSYDDRPKKKKGGNKTKKKDDDDDYSDYSDSYDAKPKKKKATKLKKPTKSKKKYDSDDEYSDSYDSYEKKPKKKKKSTKKYSDEEDYSDSADAPKKSKKKASKKKKYSDEEDYSDSDEAPKKKKKVKKKSKYSDESDFSDEPPKSKKKKKKYYSDEDSFDSDEDSYEYSKKKGKKGKKYSDESDFEDDKPSKKSVNKKDPTKGPSARTLKKKSAKAKKQKKGKNKYAVSDEEEDVPAAPPSEKRRPTMSDDEDSDDGRKKRRVVQQEKQAPKQQSNFAALMAWSDEEEEDEDDEFADMQQEPEPVMQKEEPAKPVKVDWKKKKAEEKKKKKDDDDDEFAGFFNETEEPKKLSKKALKQQQKRQRQKEKAAAAKAAAAMGGTPDDQTPPQSPTKKLSKKEAAAAQRLKKFEEEKRKREEAKKQAEDEEKRWEQERIEEEKREEEERIQREKDKEARKKIQFEQQKKAKEEKARADRLKKAGLDSSDVQARAEAAKARREAKKNKKKNQKNKRREAEEQRKRDEEEARMQREEKERQEKEEAERKKREEEERLRKEAAEKEKRARRIREMEEEARRGTTGKKKAVAKEQSSGDEWDDDESDDDVNRNDDDEPEMRSGDDAEDDWEDDESDFEEEIEPPKQIEEEDDKWDDDESDEDAEKAPKKTLAEPVKKKEEQVNAKEKSESTKPAEPKSNIVRHRKKGKEVIECNDKKILKKIAEKLKDIQKASGTKIKIDGKLGKITVIAKEDDKIDAGAAAVIKIIEKQEKKKVDMSRLRAPIGVIMGNVDAGKTKLLDYIRGTKVQDGEAGGITQQIGATNLPMSYIKEKAGDAVVQSMLSEIHLPGLLIIDTPGHAAFGNLRKRGSAMCDVAIVVVNIFNGIEGTSAQCINMLKEAEAPFLVALNQIDRLTGWVSYPGMPIKDAIEKQHRNTQDQFKNLYKNCRAQFASECMMNADLFWESSDLQKNKLRSDNINCVPTSAHSGDGVSDLLMLWVKLCQIRKLAKKLVLSPNLRCTILEVKKVQGFGHTIDVIVSDGVLRQGDTIVICGMKGPIVGKVKGLLTPAKMQDLRVKIAEYNNLKEVAASVGVRVAIVGDSLEHAVPGSQVLLVDDPKDEDELEQKKHAVQEGLKSLTNMQRDDEGVYVVASTLGALEALFGFVKDEIKIPVSGISIGTVRRKDVMRASVQLERKAAYAVILAFDVQIAPDALVLAEELGIRIMTADIIYQLQIQFQTYIDEVSSQFKDEYRDKVVFPVLMEIIPNKVFSRKDPIIFGVEIKRGTLRMNTPICAVDEGGDPIFIGRVTSIQGDEKKELEEAKRDTKVAIRIDLTNENSTKIEYKRHFSEKARLISRISRESIDTLKMYFKDEIEKEDILMIRKLKPIFNIK